MTHDTTGTDHPATESRSTTLRLEMNADAAIGQQLRTLREIAGMTIGELAELTGLPQEELDDHEHGLMPLPLTRAVILSDTLGIELSVLVDTAAWAWRRAVRESKRSDTPGFPSSPGSPGC